MDVEELHERQFVWERQKFFWLLTGALLFAVFLMVPYLQDFLKADRSDNNKIIAAVEIKFSVYESRQRELSGQVQSLELELRNVRELTTALMNARKDDHALLLALKETIVVQGPE